MMPSNKDVGLSTLYFADRPKRVLATGRRMFVEMWDEGENSFQNDPPNAVLAFLEPGDDMAEDVVIEIRNPRLERRRRGSPVGTRPCPGGHARCPACHRGEVGHGLPVGRHRRQRRRRRVGLVKPLLRPAIMKLVAMLFPRAWTKLCVIGGQGAMTWSDGGHLDPSCSRMAAWTCSTGPVASTAMMTSLARNRSRTGRVLSW
jgi:hypothetical protein